MKNSDWYKLNTVLGNLESYREELLDNDKRLLPGQVGVSVKYFDTVLKYINRSSSPDIDIIWNHMLNKGYGIINTLGICVAIIKSDLDNHDIDEILEVMRVLESYDLDTSNNDWLHTIASEIGWKIFLYKKIAMGDCFRVLHSTQAVSPMLRHICKGSDREKIEQLMTINDRDYIFNDEDAKEVCEHTFRGYRYGKVYYIMGEYDLDADLNIGYFSSREIMRLRRIVCGSGVEWGRQWNSIYVELKNNLGTLNTDRLLECVPADKISYNELGPDALLDFKKLVLVNKNGVHDLSEGLDSYLSVRKRAESVLKEDKDCFVVVHSMYGDNGAFWDIRWDR